jgi:hypothetical protein
MLLVFFHVLLRRVEALGIERTAAAVQCDVRWEVCFPFV